MHLLCAKILENLGELLILTEYNKYVALTNPHENKKLT